MSDSSSSGSEDSGPDSSENELLLNALKLPREIIHAILSNLDRANLLRCRRVSKLFCEVSSSLQFGSITIRCDPQHEYDDENLPSRAKAANTTLATIQKAPSLGRYVRQVTFDMAYSSHAVDLYQHAMHMKAHEQICRSLVRAAWGEIVLFGDVEDLTLALYDFGCAPAFNEALFEHALLLPFWQKLYKLHIKPSYFGGQDEDPPAADLTMRRTCYRTQQFIAISPHLRMLCLGDFDMDQLVAHLPDSTSLPHLEDLDIYCDIMPELTLHGLPSRVFSWISRYRQQLTNLSLRWSDWRTDDYDKSPEPLSASVSVPNFPNLRFLALEHVFHPNLLGAVLTTVAPTLQHLSLQIEDKALDHSTILHNVSIPKLQVLSLRCKLGKLQNCINYFGSISPVLSRIYLYRNWGTKLTGIGTVAALPVNHTSAKPTSRTITKFSLRQAEPMSLKSVSSLLSKFNGPMDLDVLFMGCTSSYHGNSSNDCDNCRPLVNFDLFGRRSQEEKQAKSCAKLVADCEAIVEELRAHADLVKCRIEVSGHGQPRTVCSRCRTLDSHGAFAAVRKVCAQGS